MVGHVTARVRGFVEDQTGLALPIAEVTAETLEDTVVALARDSEARFSRAEDARAFVGAVHSGARSARALLDGWITRA